MRAIETAVDFDSAQHPRIAFKMRSGASESRGVELRNDPSRSADVEVGCLVADSRNLLRIPVVENACGQPLPGVHLNFPGAGADASAPLFTPAPGTSVSHYSCELKSFTCFFASSRATP
jgi:hypothetical protein